MKKNINLDDELIAKLSKLAKLKFDKKSAEKMKVELGKIIEFVNTISKVETQNIEPLIYMGEETNILRADKVENEISQKDALKNAPQKDSDYFKVPTILKK